MPFSTADPNGGFFVGMQSGLGSPQTTVAKFRFIRWLSGTDFDPQLEIVDLREGGDGLDYGFSYKKSQKMAGQLVFNARPEMIAPILALVPGGATWDGASAPAQHNFHTGHASHPWATLQIAHPASNAHLISDVRFTGLTIEGMSGEPVKFTLPFIGINHGASTNIALAGATTYGEDPFLFHMNPTYVLDGSGDTDIVSYKYDIGLGIEELQSQAITLDEAVVQNRDTNVEVSRRFESMTEYNKINYGGGVAPTTTVASGSLRVGYSNLGAGAALRTLDLNTNGLSWRGESLTEMDPDGKSVIETLSAKALKGPTHAFFAIVKNSHASAYLS